MRQIDPLLITAIDGWRVLIVAGPDGWELPYATPDEDHFWQVVAPVNRAAAQLGLAATTLRCLQVVADTDADELRRYYALELHGEPPARPGWHWVAAADLGTFPLAHAEQHSILRRWLAGASSQIGWYRPGGTAMVAAWTQVTLTTLGRTPIGTSEQLRSWERSLLLRTPTPDGLVYTKAVPVVFSHEPALTAALATWMPGRTAAVSAHDPARGLLLLDNAGERSLAEVSDPTVWAQALTLLAELQIALTQRLPDLLQLGVPDRRIEQLPSWMDALLADEAALRWSPAGLTTDEIAALRALHPALQAACATLRAGAIPPSLEHGDCFPTQILLADDRPVVIDWSDSSISHPFFSLGFLIEPECPRPVGDHPDMLLRQAYLAPWARFASHDELARLFDAALLLAPLHHALIYHRAILPAMENGWEMERMLPYYLRLLLGHARTLLPG
jgi:Phosphotransferase enzyme family